MGKNIISVVAKSGTGKTTLLEKLISELKRRSYRVGVLKHDAHRFEIDHEGKDSWRLTQAGADTMVISSKSKLAVVKRNKQPDEPSIDLLVEKYFDDVDILLTEGFKKNSFPKIEVHRKERSNTLLCRGEVDDETLIAIASDEKLIADVPVFDINDYIGICDLIEKRFLS
ncbi:MAG: molybdopterin-guanine dinucleotide biosynthesis protein B [Deltaproteobacteria bacterium]|nr:molybdopterin-guanine dinucleotide biosynthesis protein B [Deltaproteobacteria bacterium]